MKIKVTFTLDVDPASWQENYGTDPKDIRKDVQNYFSVGADMQLESIGCKAQPQENSND
jgi:hypothetical protein